MRDAEPVEKPVSFEFVERADRIRLRCFLLPSPLWGGVGGGGRAAWHVGAVASRPPTPTLPHKGGGRRDGEPRRAPRQRGRDGVGAGFGRVEVRDAGLAEGGTRERGFG